MVQDALPLEPYVPGNKCSSFYAKTILHLGVSPGLVPGPYGD